MTYFSIRAFDFVATTIALAFFAPMLLALVIVLRFSGEGEILYKQLRIGRGGKPFFVYKFATMLKNSPMIGSGELTEYDDPRVLPVGKFLRKSKLNELPQLLNVISGDMSLVGPRPQTCRYFNLYNCRSRELIAGVKPGITGLGSLFFRDEEEIFRKSSDALWLDDNVITPYKGQLEEWFIQNRSFYLYLKILFLTVYAVMLPQYFQAERYFSGLPEMPPELRKILAIR